MTENFLMRERGVGYTPTGDGGVEVVLFPALHADSQVGDYVSVEYKGDWRNSQVTRRFVRPKTRQFRDGPMVCFTLRVFMGPKKKGEWITRSIKLEDNEEDEGF